MSDIKNVSKLSIFFNIDIKELHQATEKKLLTLFI